MGGFSRRNVFYMREFYIAYRDLPKVQPLVAIACTIRAKTENPLYPEIRNLVLKTSGLSDVLTLALIDKRIHVAFVFRSIARGEEKAGSDVDLMVIGQLGSRDLSRLLSGIEEKIGCEVNPHVLRGEDFRKRIRAKEHFVSSVMESPKIFIIGSQRELEAMGR